MKLIATYPYKQTNETLIYKSLAHWRRWELREPKPLIVPCAALAVGTLAYRRSNLTRE
jgi:hypothetical protein